MAWNKNAHKPTIRFDGAGTDSQPLYTVPQGFWRKEPEVRCCASAPFQIPSYKATESELDFGMSLIGSAQQLNNPTSLVPVVLGSSC
jgi:hypothetical protein